MSNGYSSRSMESRVVLVSGASSGLGAHFARVLAAAGASVVLVARRTDKLETIVAEIQASGGRAVGVRMDVTDPVSVGQAYEEGERAFGPIDGVIANAGMNSEGLALELGADEFDAVMATNVKGVFLTVQEAARRMIAQSSRERENGRILIISSITAHAVTPGLAAYSASKAAVVQLGRVLAREWARTGISVNILCPGYIETDLNDEWFASEGGQKQIARWPRKRLLAAEDLDATVLHLLSDATRRVTGGVFTIDDGQSL